MDIRQLLYLNSNSVLLECRETEFRKSGIFILDIDWFKYLHKGLLKSLDEINIKNVETHDLINQLFYIATSTTKGRLERKNCVDDLVSVYSTNEESVLDEMSLHLYSAIDYISDNLENTIHNYLNTENKVLLFCSMDDVLFLPKEALVLDRIDISTNYKTAHITLSFYERL